MMRDTDIRAAEQECARQEEAAVAEVTERTAAEFHRLLERQDQLELALRRVVLHLSLLQVMAAKRVAEDALELPR